MELSTFKTCGTLSLKRPLLQTYPGASRSSFAHICWCARWSLADVPSNSSALSSRQVGEWTPLKGRPDVFSLHDVENHATPQCSFEQCTVRNWIWTNPMGALAAGAAITPSGGARRDRTDDLMLAKHALSQLSYGPIQAKRQRRFGGPGKTRTSDLTLIKRAL